MLREKFVEFVGEKRFRGLALSYCTIVHDNASVSYLVHCANMNEVWLVTDWFIENMTNNRAELTYFHCFVSQFKLHTNTEAYTYSQAIWAGFWYLREQRGVLRTDAMTRSQDSIFLQEEKNIAFSVVHSSGRAVLVFSEFPFKRICPPKREKKTRKTIWVRSHTENDDCEYGRCVHMVSKRDWHENEWCIN